MVDRTGEDWINYAEGLAFVGNSLLAPMNQTGTVGLEPEFWANFPDFGSADVTKALEVLEAYAKDAQTYAESGEDPVQRASVEYTKLFVGPPRPAAAPWETLHRGEGATVGFGEPTFAMQRLLREAGLEISNENNQYADHIGIELLYASVLCTRIAEALGESGADEDGEAAVTPDTLSAFVHEHPLGWIDRLIVAVDESACGGYIADLLQLAKALLQTLA